MHMAHPRKHANQTTHTEVTISAADSLPGVDATCSEVCYVTYGTNMEHVTANIRTGKLHVELFSYIFLKV